MSRKLHFLSLRHRMLFLVFISIILSTPCNGDQGLTDSSVRLLLKLPFCAAAKKYDVSPEVLAGVFLYENQINRQIKDTIQDGVFTILLQNRDDNWWAYWAERAMKMADDTERVRLVSNKWPLEVIATGVVVSIGPAQITPRTVLRACNVLTDIDVCRHGIRYLITGLLDEDT
jgi:hypothetical protein